MRYRKVFSFKMETKGIVEVVRKQLQNWEEMRKRMLAEREGHKMVTTKKKEESDGERTDRGGRER